MRKRRCFLLTALATLTPLVCLAASATAQAQSFPTKPVRLIVGASAGGTTDALAREIAEDLGKTLGQGVIVENRPGAGGNLAAMEVARAVPDGHTLLVSFTSHTMNTILFKKLPYDPVADFTPITLLAKVSSVLVARPDFPAKDMKELLALGKADKRGLTFAIGGVGSSLQMDTYAFAAAANIAATQIPFKGTSPALVDVMGAHVDLMFAPVGGARPLLQAGKLRTYAVTGTRRLPGIPEAPPLHEALPGFRTNYGWFGLLGPAKLPPSITSALHAATVKALQTPKLKARLEVEGTLPEGNTPEEFAAFLQSDIKHWALQGKAFGIQPE